MKRIEMKNNRVYMNGVPLHHVGSSSRRVWGNDKYVVKVESCYTVSFSSQNKDEYNFYKSLSPSQRKYFVPVLQYGQFKDNKGHEYDYVIQKRIYGVLLDDLYSMVKISKEFENKVNRFINKVRTTKIDDLHDGNIMVLSDGSLKVFDMGLSTL